MVEKNSKSKKEKIKLSSSIPVYDIEGKEVGKFELDREIFTGDINKGLLYQTVVMYNANKRRGTASTKTISEVRGGGRKPWRQKGTGRARVSTIRSPLWRGGGVVFGPHPRDYHYQIPKKIRRLALLSSLNSKLKEEKMIGLDSLAVSEPKTKNFKAILDSFKLTGKKVLFVAESIDDKIKRSSRNIPDVDVKSYRDFNTMDVLTHDNLVVSRGALEKLTERFKVK